MNYKKYLITENTFKQEFMSNIIKMSKMDNGTDELDNTTFNLMQAIENQGYKVNKEETQPKTYNNRIKLIKQVTNLISDMVDDTNKKPYIKKISDLVYKIFK